MGVALLSVRDGTGSVDETTNPVAVVDPTDEGVKAEEGNDDDKSIVDG
jgi:hypothetical protein